MKKQMSLIFCTVLLVSSKTPESISNLWAPLQTKDGIRSFIGKKNEHGVTPTKVEMSVPVAAEKVVRVIANLDDYHKWVPYCKKSHTIERVSEMVSYGYQRISPPMIADRDIAVRLTVKSINKKEYEVMISAVPNFIKQEKNTIRIHHLNVLYKIHENDEGLTHIIQESELDIGGSIPDFLQQWARKNMPCETFQNLKQQILHV